MPVKIHGVSKSRVRVSTPGGVKAKSTTPAKARRQANLLHGIKHGFKPTGRKAGK